jgi:hypothetical protein
MSYSTRKGCQGMHVGIEEFSNNAANTTVCSEGGFHALSGDG